MLLRISLIVAILAGLAVAGLTHLKVAEKITNLTTERDDYQQKMTVAQKAETDAKKQAKKASDDLKAANKTLAEATNSLIAMTVKANQQEKRANESVAQLETTANDRNKAQQELAAWKATGLTPDRIQEVVNRLKKTEIERDIFNEEKVVLIRNNKKIQAQLDLFIKPGERVEMREGLKGKVIAVDPKWDFVVLDVGADQGALERGELLVNRDGKLVAKVKLTSVKQSRSIANILPEWKQVDIKEGDQVIY